MVAKKLVRLNCCAEGLEEALENLILIKALNSKNNLKSFDCAEEIAVLVSEKAVLSDLNFETEKALCRVSADERLILEEWAATRTKFDDENKKPALRRASAKFMRRMNMYKNIEEGIEVLDKYYYLLVPK